MKYFGEYLVSKNIVTEEILADVLVEQQSSLPSLLQIIHQKKLVSASQILKALAWQTENQVEFKRALKETQVWTEQIEKEVRDALELSRVPIGHLLIKKGATDLVTMTKALDEFLSRIEIVAKTEPKIEPKKTVGTTKKIDPLLLEEFLNYLTDTRLSETQNLVEIFHQSCDDKDMSLPILKEVVVTIHSIKGLMRCIQISKGESMMEQLEKMIVASIEGSEKGKTDGNKATAAAALTVLSELSKLRAVLISDSSEDAWANQWSSL